MKMIRTSVALAAAALAVSAGATTLDFEGLTNQQAQSLNSAAPGYGGFTWDANFVLFNTSVYGVQVGSGSYGIVNNIGSNPAVITVSSSSAFDFNSAFIGGWSFNWPTQITVEGYDASNTLIDSQVVSISQSVGSVVNFNFTGLTTLKITGGKYWVIDDFKFNETNSVPEPTSLALFALAALGAAGATRAAKRRA